MITDWEQTTLGDKIELIYGKSLPKRDRVDGDYPVYGSNGIVGYHNKSLVRGPGIIVGRKGSCGEVHYSNSDFWPIDTTYYVNLIKKNNMKFIAYYLSSLGLNHMNSHSTIPGLNRKNVYEIDCQFPSLLEQKKIAAVLYKIQKAIEVQGKIIESTKELKKTTMQRLFTKGLRGEKTKQTEIGEIPESWSVGNFNELATLHRGYDLPVQSRKDGNVPIIGSNGLVGYHNVSKVKGPGVVTGRSGSIGISYYIDEDYWPLNTGLYVEDFHENDPLYTHYFFEWFDFNQYASGVSVPTLNRNFVHAARIAIPKKNEQHEISKIMKTLDCKIDFNDSKKNNLQNLFKSMLNKLMTGDIRVKDLKIDVEEVEDSRGQKGEEPNVKDMN